MTDFHALIHSYQNCACGQAHTCAIRDIEIGSGLVRSVGDILRKNGFGPRLLLAADEQTLAAAEGIEASLAGFAVVRHIWPTIRVATMQDVEKIESYFDRVDGVLAVGTGSVHDPCRLACARHDVPLCLFATAPSMDGFASYSAPIVNGNFKITYPAKCPEVIIGDTDILKTAPYRMTVAGFGDLIGKLTCLNDWELARIINGEHYCHNIVTLVRECVADVMKEAPKIKQRDPETLGSVMRGLVLSGAAISLYGDSRPASGAEHHMSHYWETILEQRGVRPAMHGEQVAVGTVLVLMLIEELLKEDVDFDAARESARAYDAAAWEREIRAHYGAAADEVVAMEHKAGKNAVEGRLTRIDSMQRNWDAVRAQLETLPTSTSVRALLRDIGCPCTPADIGVDDELLMDTFRYCKEIRARYTVFQTVYDLGLTDKLAARVTAKANSAD